MLSGTECADSDENKYSASRAIQSAQNCAFRE